MCLNNDKKYVYIVLSWSLAVTYPNSLNGRGICAFRTFYVWLRFTFEVNVLCAIVLYCTAIYRGFLTHWGRVTHIYVSKLTIIGSDNGLSPDRRQAIIWTNAGILLIGPLGTNFSEILIGIQTFSFKKMRLKMSSAKWRPFCLGLNVLMSCYVDILSKQGECLRCLLDCHKMISMA